MSVVLPLEQTDAPAGGKRSIRGPKPQHGLNSAVSFISPQQAGRSPDKSPSKVPLQLKQQGTDQFSKQNDVLDSKRSIDQRSLDLDVPSQPSQSPGSASKSSKYLQLLNVAYLPGMRAKASSRGQLAGAEAAPRPVAVSSKPQPSPVRSRSTADAALCIPGIASNAAASVAPAAKTAVTAMGRTIRSRTSILDSSPGGSLIPISPAPPPPQAAVCGISVSAGTPPAAGNAGVEAVLARRSLSGTPGKPQYAFGSRVDPNPARKPSPMRQPALTATDCIRASPQRMQRVPAAAGAAKKSGVSGPQRSASAPRVSNADKVQSRFQQHQAKAAAAVRSKTPNPVVRGSSSAGSSHMNSRASSRGRPSSPLMQSEAEQSRITQMKTPDLLSTHTGSAAAALGSNSATRTPAVLQAASAHAQAAAAFAGSKVVIPTSLSLPSFQSTLGGSKVGKSPARPTVAQLSQQAGSSLGSRITVPYLQLGNGDKAGASAAVPRLSLGGLSGLVAEPALQRSREHDDSNNLGDSALQQGNAAAQQRAQRADLKQQPSVQLATSPFLGRMSGGLASPQAAASTGAAVKHANAAGRQQQQQQAGQLQQTTGVHNTGLKPSGDSSQADAQQPASKSVVPQLELKQAACFQQQAQRQPAAAGEAMSPPRVTRELSNDDGLCSPFCLGASSAVPRELPGELSRELSHRGSLHSIESAIAIAAKGLVLPLSNLDEQRSGAFASPPKHRRGERASPKGAAAVACSQLLKSKASNLCSSSGQTDGSDVDDLYGKATASAELAAAPASSVSFNAAAELFAAKQHTSARGAAEQVNGAASVLQQQQQLMVNGNYVTPKASIPGLQLGAAQSAGAKSRPDTSPGQARTLALSPGDKPRMAVPKLDLTSVFCQQEESPTAAAAMAELASGHQQQQQQLLLEHQPSAGGVAGGHDAGKLELVQGISASKHSSGKPSGKHSSKSAGAPGSKGSGKGSKGSHPDRAQQPQQEEAFYVYQEVMPAEETRTYEELKRAVQKCPGGNRLAASLQGIWGCYQDARRNTEAMAFRGHRLLDQVSNEYKAYKRDAEQQIEQLQQESDVYKEEMQLALTVGMASPSALELAKKDQQVQQLQAEVQQLKLQLGEMEKALQMASDYHHAQQADQVPVKARAIAGSATTSILFQQTLEQQQELQENKKAIADMKAALMIACGALKHTNYMDVCGPARAVLEPDTLAVLDTMLQATDAEAVMFDHAAAQDAAAQSSAEATIIEEQ